MANDRLDLIIFGATGYTGKFVVKHAASFCKEWQIKFGVAGRRKEALEAVVNEFAPDFENIPIILADVNDEESIRKMTEQAKVLVNCCGPYKFYGEPVVKACIATCTHYVDVTGETEFMEKMQLEYNKAAQKAGVYIISGCGFDCIASEMGILFTQKKFQGEVNSIETYLKFWTVGDMEKSAFGNYGTWESLINSLANIHKLREIRSKLFSEKLPELTPKLKSRGNLHRSDVSEGWSIAFKSSDRPTAYRTQRFLYEKYKERPAQVEAYLTLESFCGFVMITFGSLIIALMCRMACTRNLLLKYPSLFSFGLISKEGPNPEALERTRFSITFRALGWSEKLTEPTDRHTDAPNKELVTKVSASAPAYGFTSIALMISVIMILKESDKMPDNGGVLPPGAAFSKTSMIEELIKKGVKFEVISSEK